jgi:hypothetical protein
VADVLGGEPVVPLHDLLLGGVVPAPLQQRPLAAPDPHVDGEEQLAAGALAGAADLGEVGDLLEVVEVVAGQGDQVPVGHAEARCELDLLGPGGTVADGLVLELVVALHRRHGPRRSPAVPSEQRDHRPVTAEALQAQQFARDQRGASAAGGMAIPVWPRPGPAVATLGYQRMRHRDQLPVRSAQTASLAPRWPAARAARTGLGEPHPAPTGNQGRAARPGTADRACKRLELVDTGRRAASA